MGIQEARTQERDVSIAEREHFGYLPQDGVDT